MKLKKNDTVRIMSGKDRGKTGKVLIAMPQADRVILDGLNIFKKRSRPKKQGETGQTVNVPRSMPASKVMLICTNCKNPTRVGFRAENVACVRYCN